MPLTGPVSSKPVEKLDQPKKFVNTGLLNKAAQENTKVKAPTKDYLEADSGAKYKEQTPEVEIEKPRFVNKNVGDSSEPHFKDINKNEDVSRIKFIFFNFSYFYLFFPRLSFKHI